MTQKARPVNTKNMTFFQQKWHAKRVTRGYHGEHIREKQWSRMFSRRLLSVVSMSPRYLAQYDGSEQATGRGSGRHIDPLSEEGETRKQSTPVETPYMQMTFAPMERRLDTAIFRALFASSVRQARQLVIHGSVKVNGRKVSYPVEPRRET
jgi:ribosomal protein S4